MFRTIMTDGTLAYMGFLVLLASYKLISGRKSRKLRKRIKAWTS